MIQYLSILKTNIYEKDSIHFYKEIYLNQKLMQVYIYLKYGEIFLLEIFLKEMKWTWNQP